MNEPTEILTTLKDEFKRYFDFTDSLASSSGHAFSGLFRSSDDRESLSEIVAGLIYLGPLSKYHKFMQKVENSHGALIISCIDIRELARSSLLSDLQSSKVRHHLLPMEDRTATVGSNDHIYDALKIMSEFTAQKKPIFIHCREGVGRSPMITVIYIALLYMMNNPDIRSCIDGYKANNLTQLNPDSEEYVENIYLAVMDYIKKTKRHCCQFNEPARHTLAREVLKALHQQNKIGQLMRSSRDENYRFLSTLVQSPQFKNLQQYCTSLRHWDCVNIYGPETTANSDSQAPNIVAIIDPLKCIVNFSNSFLLNQTGWYKQLQNALSDVQSVLDNTNNPLYQFCNFVANLRGEDQNAIKAKRRKLISELIDVIRQLATSYPQALFSQTVATFHQQPAAAVMPSVDKPQLTSV